jgi:hypothetical protein
MSKKAIGEYILIDPEDVPTLEDVEDAVKAMDRLSAVLKEFKRKDDPDPARLARVKSFLRLIAERESKRLKREKKG